MSLLDAAGVVTGDIWCSGAFSFESPLKDLLDSGEYTLEQLLGEDELLQELRGIHPQLIDFFSTEEALAGLIRYVTLPPNGPAPPKPPTTTPSPSPGDDDDDDDAGVAKPEDVELPDDKENDDAEDNEEEDPAETQQDEQQHEKDAVFVRYPYMACEVICCEVKGIIDTLVDGLVPVDEDAAQTVVSSDDAVEAGAEVTRPKTILDLLFDMLYDSKAGEIDDYRAGYFDKVLSVLLRKRPQALGQYINEGGGRGSEVLMKAMFKHLYSHSAMQIVQRLLLPQPPLPPKNEDDSDKEGEELFADPMEGADMDGFGSFRCNWSESETALELLLDCLIEKSPHPGIENEEERRLSLYQNASEVLITIIQNSPLTSPTLHALTSDPVLERLILAASCPEKGTKFSPHDSRLTCTMNVLESLILQLGGYGSVGTVMFPEDDEDGEGDEENPDESIEVMHSDAPSQPGVMRQELATSDTLISHLPVMLSNLCKLLLSPDADEWVSPMQFSRHEPQKILGSSRLRIVRLLESLVLLGDPNVDSLLCESNCLEICLDLFWKFQWCSMLHQSVANLLVHVFEGANTRAELQSYFLGKCNLLGRLMDSFWEGPEDGLVSGSAESDARLSEAVLAMKSESANPPTSSLASERGSPATSDVIPVSDDDVDAALEQEEAKNNDETDADATNKGSEELSAQEIVAHGSAEHTPAQSFRLGYMGHVIIICQALVHACSNDGGKSEAPSVDPSADTNGELGNFVSHHNIEDQDPLPQEGVALHDTIEAGRAADSVVTDETPLNPLILAALVETHPSRDRWHDFVKSTLQSETAIQSTPLGGFLGSNSAMDPLHSHRPGLAEDDDYADDDGAAPPLPPRGLLVGGDVIDMDDNDLDVAASMMAGLSLGRPAEGESRNDQDLLAGIPQQGTGLPHAGGYMFDDPLGSGRFSNFDDDEDSSDEESELSGNTGDSGGAVFEGVQNEVAEADAEAPVMDLFAGNLDPFGDKQDPENQQGSDWSDFANFDNAFAGATDSAESQEWGARDTNGALDEIFGDVKDHANLLEEIPDQESGVKDSDDIDKDGPVAAKVDSMDEDSSDEEPVSEQEEQEESLETSSDS
jgi:hypothetical protein